jgi:8-amino-7-oxononanoate synthase
VKWLEWVDGENDEVRAAGRWRTLRTFDPDSDGGGVAGRLAGHDGEVVSFASNDYLGLTQHPAVVSAARAALDRFGTGAGSARLIVGTRSAHAELEAALAEWKRADAALVFPTGFAANLSVLSVFADATTTIFSDALNHASIIDGCRLSPARVEIYAHNDVDDLGRRLRHLRGGRRAVVVTDTVFSMDGDVADIHAVADLCARAGALLIIDEAHSVLGPDPDLDGVDALRVGTLSKFLGALGGFVAGPRPFVELLVNRARPFIFTTALTPADTAAAHAALAVYRSAEGARLRDRLRGHVDRLRAGHPSPIVPIVLGDEARAVTAAAALLDRGILVPAIRPPTVAPGTSRLRVTLSAAHTDGHVNELLAALHDIDASP